MDTERYKKIKEIFDAALQRGGEDRGGFLDEACRGDVALRGEVEALLDADSEAGDFLKTLPAGTLPDAERDPPLIDKRVGHFRVTRRIASGGMGTVYEALQENPRRIVALKVLRAGIASSSTLRRFEYEAQILARLRHPNIAQVFEAGTFREEGKTEGKEEPGLPYFVMEYITGARTITDYAAEQGLGLRSRIELILQVLGAVQHGHGKGVIHRDLKPSNILVDNQGTVKVIDFGVARATDSDMAITTLHTETGQLIGTLQYMSPEQCKGDPRDLDVRSDVYALGIILYELLCRRLPYDVQGSAVFEAARKIREEEPRPPSLVNRELKGDLEIIVMKSLEKSRESRYQSVGELAGDLSRFLKGEVILARPAGPVTRIAKAVRRHPVWSASSAAASIVLVGFALYVILYSYPRIVAERNRAQAESGKFQAITNYLREILSSADPDRAGQEVRVVDLLDAGVPKLDTAFEGQPEIEAALRHTMAETYFSLGQYEPAYELFDAAYRIRRDLFGEENPDTLRSLIDLGLASQMIGQLAKAREEYDRVLELAPRVWSEDEPDLHVLKHNYSGLLFNLGEFEAAENLLRRALSARGSVSNPDSIDRMNYMNALAICLWRQFKTEEAESLLRGVLESKKRLLGENHTSTLSTLNGLGLVLEDKGDLAGAEALFREAIQSREDLLKGGHPDLVLIQSNLAELVFRQGRQEEALALRRDCLDAALRALGPDHPISSNMVSKLAGLLYKQGNYAEAEPLFSSLLEAVERGDPGDPLEIGLKCLDLGRCRWGMLNYPAAEELLLRAYSQVSGIQGEEGPEAKETAFALYSFYIDWEKPEKAEQWKPGAERVGNE